METAGKASGAEQQPSGPEDVAPADKDCGGTIDGQDRAGDGERGRKDANPAGLQQRLTEAAAKFRPPLLTMGCSMPAAPNPARAR